MSLTEAACKIKADLEAFIAGTPYALNPDEKVLNTVLNGLATREEKTGKRYCPCRLMTGNEEADRKIICPCEYHVEELEQKGICHCQLLVKREG
ncbi:MAG: ferredoxin-thioredoxin reductase catalytic domain-containing protein [Planctomycetota bacterium]|jgi:ferredoxin-thioredoxin reductase catalytic subunit